MKHCPHCKSQYTDETLLFCLQDGNSLVDEVKQSSIDTVAFTNPVTVEKFLQTEEMRVNFPAQTQNWNEPLAPVIEPTKPNSSRMLWTIALPVLVVLSASGFGGWYYLNNQTAISKTTISNSPEKNLPANTSLVSAETISEKPHQSPKTNSDNKDVKKEISDFINSWKESFESRNLAENSAKYAETVDYFDKNGADINQIRSEIQKIFNSYKEIELTLSNIQIAIDADDDKATAIFDKEWSFETGNGLEEGKAHTKLQFEKIGNQWKIVSEKILKTYYVEN